LKDGRYEIPTSNEKIEQSIDLSELDHAMLGKHRNRSWRLKPNTNKASVFVHIIGIFRKARAILDQILGQAIRKAFVGARCRLRFSVK
jgi:hypothetical protein